MQILSLQLKVSFRQSSALDKGKISEDFFKDITEKNSPPELQWKFAFSNGAYVVPI